MMKFYKLMFLITLIVSTLISISSYSWMGMWMGLEINLISMIPLMKNHKNMLTSESLIKYFISQVMASTILIMSIIMIMSSNFLENNNFIEKNLALMLNSSLLMKMGAAPMHFWFPEVIEGLSWINSGILLTWQKIAPMMIFSYVNKSQLTMTIIIMMSMMISGISGLNQISIRKILAFSSINHLGWMLSMMMVSETMWMIYFIIYTMISVNMIILLKTLNIFFLKQMFNSMNNNNKLKLSLMVNFLSLGGIPPFIGFLPKWLTIQMLINKNLIMLALMMIILTLMTLYFYTRMMLPSMLLGINQINWSKKILSKNLYIQFSMNMLINMSLILCTSMFNWM